MLEKNFLPSSATTARSIAHVVLTLLLAAGSPATRAADLDVDTLRRQVRNLERTLTDVERRLEQVESAVRGAVPDRTGQAAAGPQAPAQHAVPGWVDVRPWHSLGTGMTTQEVIAILGEPTAVRPGRDAAERLLLYTLELDTNAFLSGSVRIRDDRVVAIELPALR